MRKLILVMIAIMAAFATAPAFAATGDPPEVQTEQTITTPSNDNAVTVPAPTIETNIEVIQPESAKTHGNGWTSFLITTAVLILLIPFVCQFITRAIPAAGLTKQILCWCAGIAITFILWLIPFGWLTTMLWPITIFYGWVVSLAGNGLYDTGLLDWMKPKHK